jgi:TolB-like protein/DNA-binding winged helix-turn-helix (wHTH) protein/Flp pilus assembly protein TadD
MQTAPAHIYEFGAFQLDTAERLLRQLDGTPVPLTPRVFKTLLYMVEHHNAVLDKERIMEAVWPDSIVEENNLAQAISKLRHVFGETPASESYIVTVPGRGYRFAAEVKERPADAVSTVPKVRQADEVVPRRAFAADHARTRTQSYESTPAGPGRQRDQGPAERRWLFAAAILAVVMVSLAALFFVRYRGPNSPVAAGTATSVAARIPEKSIAVLPFEPLGQDMNDGLLGLGMADAVIGKMSNVKELVVLPTSAVSKYQGPANDPLAAGRALGVDAILSGTVQRSGDRVRATVQLARVATGRTVWSAKFDQTFTSIFDIQDAISDKVVQSLALNLTAAEQKQLAKRYTANADAYDSYLMGLYFWNKRSKEGLEKAIDYFGQAVARDPNFALAYALMSDCYYLQRYYGYDRRSDRIQNAKAAAERALLLDDTIAEAHVALAMVQFYQKGHQHAESDHQAGVDSLRRAIALNPNLAIAHQRYAWCLSAFGHLDEAVREMKRAQELDPLSPTNNTALGIVLALARQYQEALAYCYKAAELAPNEAPMHENLAFAYTLNGMYEQAIKHYQRVGELNPEKKGDALAWIATVLVLAGRKSEADSMMADIVDLALAGRADPYNIAVLYGRRGEKDAAFEWFGKALVMGRELPTNGNDTRMIRFDPMLDPLRSDSRFAALLRQHDRASLLEVWQEGEVAKTKE